MSLVKNIDSVRQYGRKSQRFFKELSDVLKLYNAHIRFTHTGVSITAHGKIIYQSDVWAFDEITVDLGSREGTAQDSDDVMMKIMKVLNRYNMGLCGDHDRKCIYTYTGYPDKYFLVYKFPSCDICKKSILDILDKIKSENPEYD